jgi:L-2-hydroxyglutarate oxidase LhgO
MDVDILIIGGGVVGLACAAESARGRHSTLLVERHGSFGQETSSRNSEVVHSGIYYPTGSLKARLCVAGNRTTYADCERFGVWHQRCGKLVVAVAKEEEAELENIYKRGLSNGVEGLEMLTRGDVAKIEPAIVCTSALLVPSTGIFDSHELMRAYLNEARAGRVDSMFGVEYLGAARKNGTYSVTLKDTTGEQITVKSRYVVNAAGLSSDRVAQSFGIEVGAADYRIYPSRGHYYRVAPAKSRLVSRLVYPVPNLRLTGLGIHITLDKAGQMKLGPDTEDLDPESSPGDWYKFDDTRREKFHKAVSRYFPALQLDDLSPDQVGVRPKKQPPGAPAADFVIREEGERGLPGLVNLIGIDSPGLTSAREIAREVFRLIGA